MTGNEQQEAGPFDVLKPLAAGAAAIVVPIGLAMVAMSSLPEHGELAALAIVLLGFAVVNVLWLRWIK